MTTRWCRWCGESSLVIMPSMACAAKECYNYDLADSLGFRPDQYADFLLNPPYRSTLIVGNTGMNTTISVSHTNQTDTTWTDISPYVTNITVSNSTEG